MRRLVLLAALSIGALVAGTLYLVIAEDSGSARSDEDFESLDEDGDLDALADDCGDGDMEACDDLYYRSPLGSEHERFGSTCGDRREETEGSCS